MERSQCGLLGCFKEGEWFYRLLKLFELIYPPQSHRAMQTVHTAGLSITRIRHGYDATPTTALPRTAQQHRRGRECSTRLLPATCLKAPCLCVSTHPSPSYQHTANATYSCSMCLYAHNPSSRQSCGLYTIVRIPSRSERYAHSHPVLISTAALRSNHNCLSGVVVTPWT